MHNSTDGRIVFQACTRGYSDDMLEPELMENGDVCLSNVNSASIANGSLYHFLCSTDPCNDDDECLLRTLISSHIIIFSGIRPVRRLLKRGGA